MPRSQEGGGVFWGLGGSPSGRATLTVNMGVMAAPGSGSASRVDTPSRDVGVCLPTRGITARTPLPHLRQTPEADEGEGSVGGRES